MTQEILDAEKQYLANLLEAIQRCIYFLESSDRKLSWPLDGMVLEARKKDEALFESLAAINERFAKLQDTLGAALRHAVILLGESEEGFLKILSYYEKAGVIESVESWQLARTARNLAAHDYETRYREIANHFNALHQLRLPLYRTAERLLQHCRLNLGVMPISNDFSIEFAEILGQAK